MGSIFDKTATYTTLASGRYLVAQVTMTEAFVGKGSKQSSLNLLQNTINKIAAKGYRLHSMSTAAVFSKSFLGGDKNQVTLVFERDNTIALLVDVLSYLKDIRNKLVDDSPNSKEIEKDIVCKEQEIKDKVDESFDEVDYESKILTALAVMDTRTISDLIEKDKDDILKEIVYEDAKDKLKSGKNASAKALFRLLYDYKDSKDIFETII